MWLKSVHFRRNRIEIHPTSYVTMITCFSKENNGIKIVHLYIFNAKIYQIRQKFQVKNL